MRAIPAGISAVISAESNKPVELYEIYLSGLTLRYARYNSDVTFGGNLYTAIGITRTAISTNISLEPNIVTVELDNTDLTLAAYFENNRYEWRGCNLKIKKVFIGYLTTATDYMLLFDGTIDEPEANQEKIRLRVKSWVAALQRTCPRRKYQSVCQWTFGSTECGATKTTMTGTITVVTSTTDLVLNLTGTDPAADYWNNGYLTITAATGQQETRRIKTSIPATEVYLYSPFRDVTPVAGLVVSITNGCDKTKTTCNDIHNNILNYGGFLGLIDSFSISTRQTYS